MGGSESEIIHLLDKLKEALESEAGDRLRGAISGETVISKTSGQIHIARISGETVISKTSGETHIVKTSGETHIAKTSGETHIAKISGEAVDIYAYDEVASGDRRLVSFMPKGTAQTRLLTGVDVKHIRINDPFTGSAFDSVVWSNTVGTVTVTNGVADLYHVHNDTDLTSHELFLYGRLTFCAKMQDYGSIGIYRSGTEAGGTIRLDMHAVAGDTFVTQNYQTGEATTETAVTIDKNAYHRYTIVWTPEYCQFYIDGVLKATHTSSIPQNALAVRMYGVAGNHLYLDNVVLASLGEVPLTTMGKMPVTGFSGETVTTRVGKPTAVKTGPVRQISSSSGGVVLHSGSVVAVTVKAHPDNSGHMYVGGDSADGGDPPYSGFGMLLESGDAWAFNVDDFDAIRVFAAVSGDYVVFGGVEY